MEQSEQMQQMELEEYRSGKKSLELSCYIAGAGAFGVFVRWLQLQMAFNELGLADKSVFHILVLLFVLAAGTLFWYFVRRFEKQRFYLPDEYTAAFSNEGRLYRIVCIAGGLIVCAGAALLYMQTGDDRNAADYRTLAILAILAGISFPVWLSFANSKTPVNINMLCVAAFLTMLFPAAWIVICYKLNTINSVEWSYIPELVTAAAAMFAFFRLGGYVFGRPRWRATLFTCMLATMLCIMSLADERFLGLQVILIGLAVELLLCCWIMVKNFCKGEAPPKKAKSTGGFEILD